MSTSSSSTPVLALPVPNAVALFSGVPIKKDFATPPVTSVVPVPATVVTAAWESVVIMLTAPAMSRAGAEDPSTIFPTNSPSVTNGAG